MKKSVLVSVFVVLFAFGAKSRNRNQASFQFSYNQIELGYQYKFIHQKIWGEAFAGLGNQDINSSFDDFLTGIRIGGAVFSNDKNTIDLTAGFGVYFPNNNYYSAATSVLGGGLRYSRFIGKTKKHSLFLNAGYQYGKRDYKQEYLNDEIYVATISKFKISPMYFSIGYGFNF